MWLLVTCFDAWCHDKIANGVVGWVTRDNMICDLPEHGKMQPNHPDPVGPPLDYMGECWVFDSIRSDIYDLCHFYTLGMTGDLSEFPAPQELAIHGQVRDLLKLARSISRPYPILVHSTDLITAVSMLRELHTAMCLWHLQVDLWDRSIKLSFWPFCTHTRPQVMGRWHQMVKNGRSTFIPKTPSLALVRSLVNTRTQTQSWTLERKSSLSSESST